ncbi:MAG: DNA internalization-related competence protein ComEC/Rec2 [Enterococcus sp.]
MRKFLFYYFHNRMIYLAIVAGASTVIYATQHLFVRICFFVLILFIVLKESKQIRIACVVVSLGVLLNCFMHETTLLSTGEQTLKVQLVSDSIEVNGDLVNFDAYLSDHRKIHIYYQLENKAERAKVLSWRSKDKQFILSGTVETPDTASNPYAFNQKEYMKNYHLAGFFTCTKINYVTSTSNSWTIFHKIRGSLITQLQKNLPQKTASYVTALILGFQDSSFSDSKKIFNAVGIIHLFSLSGMHVQVYLGFAYYLFRKCRRTLRQSIGPLTVVTICYLQLTGGAVSILRAGILFVLRLFFRLFHIRLSEMDLFSLVVLLLLFIEPYAIVQTGGQLSVAITFFLLFVSPYAATIKEKVVQAIQLNFFMFPILTWCFFVWHPFAAFWTLILSPVFCFVLLPLAVLLCIFYPIIPENILHLVEQCLQLFEKLLLHFSGPSITVGRWSFLITLVSTCLYLYWFSPRKKKDYRYLLFSSLFTLLLMNKAVVDSQVSVSFVDVGQGDSIFIKAPNNQENILIDTGGQIGFETEQWRKRNTTPKSDRDIVVYLKGMGIRTIDKIILTHGDMDHVGELVNIIEQFKVKTILIGEGSAAKDELRERLLVAAKQGITIQEVRRGSQLNDYFHMTILAPKEKGTGENEDSVVVQTTIKNKRFLFMGDLDQQNEKEIIRSYPKLKTDVLKVGHHGSNTASAKEFIAQVEPHDAIISCGKENRFGHPHMETLETLKDAQSVILRTDMQGTITYSWQLSTQKWQIQTMAK